MEFFHEPNIDWMGRKWYFISVSLALLVAGLISIAIHGGLVYGIEFRSGTQVEVKFAKAADIAASSTKRIGKGRRSRVSVLQPKIP